MKWARAEGTGIISENATGRCAARDSVVVLNECANAGALETVHDKIIESGCKFDVFVGSSLVDIYAKAEGTGTILTNATRRSAAARLCLFMWGC
jgi:hypothetical protein